MTAPYDGQGPPDHEAWEGRDRRRYRDYSVEGDACNICVYHAQNMERMTNVEKVIAEVQHTMYQQGMDLSSLKSAGSVRTWITGLMITVLIFFGAAIRDEFKELQGIVYKGMQKRIELEGADKTQAEVLRRMGEDIEELKRYSIGYNRRNGKP